jgi:hypothetical protein
LERRLILPPFLKRNYLVDVGDSLTAAEPEASADAEAAGDPDAAADTDAIGVVVAVTMGVGVGVGINVTSTVTMGVGVGAEGLHAVNNTANNNTAIATKMIFLFI